MDIMELLTRARRSGVRRHGRDRRRSKSRHYGRPKVSVIIPAHNEEAYLGRTLAALRRQDCPVEIIVVANGCTDRTAEVARERCDRLVVLSQKSLGVARNLGARMASHPILLFLDADTILQRHAIREVTRAFTRGTAAATVRGKPDTSRLIYRLMYFLKNTTHKLRVHEGSAGVIICWKDHFVKLGGFDENLEVCENSELIRRLRRFGTYRFIGKATAITSMRRYERRGMWRMTCLWTRLWIESFFRDLHHRKYETIR